MDLVRIFSDLVKPFAMWAARKLTFISAVTGVTAFALYWYFGEIKMTAVTGVLLVVGFVAFVGIVWYVRSKLRAVFGPHDTES